MAVYVQLKSHMALNNDAATNLWSGQLAEAPAVGDYLNTGAAIYKIIARVFHPGGNTVPYVEVYAKRVNTLS